MNPAYTWVLITDIKVCIYLGLFWVPVSVLVVIQSFSEPRYWWKNLFCKSVCISLGIHWGPGVSHGIYWGLFWVPVSVRYRFRGIQSISISPEILVSSLPQTIIKKVNYNEAWIMDILLVNFFGHLTFGLIKLCT